MHQNCSAGPKKPNNAPHFYLLILLLSCEFLVNILNKVLGKLAKKGAFGAIMSANIMTLFRWFPPKLPLHRVGGFAHHPFVAMLYKKRFSMVISSAG